MRRFNRLANRVAAVIILAILTLVLSACRGAEFGVTENTGKSMTITARNAAKDDFFMVGSLEVAEGEQIVITGDLTKGTVRVEIIAAPAGQSIDEVPQMDGETIITANISTTNGAAGTVPEGTYFLKATCLEKATGTIWVEVKPV